MYLINVFGNKYSSYLLILVYFIITLLLYVGSINNYFVLDDFVRLKVIVDGQLHENFHFIPVPLLLYRFIFSIYGMDPAPYRILFFIINSFFCLLLYKTALIVFRKYAEENLRKYAHQLAFLTSLFFCVHYIHVETLIYFSELHELLYSLFYLLAVYLYLKYKCDSNRYVYYSIFAAFTISILSKETAVTFIAVVFCSEYFLYSQKISAIFKKYWALILITSSFILVRLFIFPNLENLQANRDIIFISKEIVKNILFTFTAFFFSLDFSSIKIIYKSLDVNFINVFSELLRIYPFALLAIVLSLSFYVFALSRKNIIAYISIIFILITSSSYIWLAGYERYLYLPSAGFWILFVYIVFKISIFKLRFIKWFIILIVLVYNVFNLKLKEQNWLIASQISKSAVANIIDETKNLPDSSTVFFKNLPDEYKGAWILRYGIHQIPDLFLVNRKIEFYYYYEYIPGNNASENVFFYDYNSKKFIK